MEIEIIQGTTARSVLAPVVVNTYSGLQVPAFWRAMEFLSSNLAAFTISVRKDGLKIEGSHSLDPFFTRMANQIQNAFTMWKTWYFHGEHIGNGYAYVRRADPSSQAVVGIHTLLPEDVVPYRLVPQGGALWDASIWYWHGPSQKAIPSADVLHYRSQISYDGFVGYSPIQVFSATIRQALQLVVYQTKWLEKGSMIRGSIELPAGTTKEQSDEIIDTMLHYRASTGDRDVMVLSGGAKLENKTVSPVDSQLIEQDHEVTKKISQITGIAPQFLFESAESKYNAATVEAVGEDVVRFVFRSRLMAIENELTTKLLTEEEQAAGYTVYLDTAALQRGDTAVEMTTAAQGVAAGLITKNEGRNAIGEAPVSDPAADRLLTPTSVATESVSQSESETHAAMPSPDLYAAFAPLIDDAAQRVETKTAKALATAEKKPQGQRIPYTNALAESQARYAAEAFAPIAAAMELATGKKFDFAGMAEHYGAEIRRRAAGQATEIPLVVYAKGLFQ